METYNEQTSFDKFKKQIKISIFRTYYKMISIQFRMNTLYILIIAIEAIQIIGLSVFNILYSNGQINQISTNSDKNVAQLVSTLKIIFMFHPLGNYLASQIIMYIFIGLFMIQFGLFCFFNKNPPNYKIEQNYLSIILLRFFLILNILYQKIFTIPIFITFFSFFQCKTVTANSIISSLMLNFPTLACSSKSYYINFSLSCFGLILFLIISYLNCLYLNDNRPISNLPWAGPYSKQTYLHLFIKIMLTFFYVFKFTETSDSPIFDIKVILILTLFIIQLAIRFFNHFFHHRIVGCFTVILEGSFVFNALVGLINKYLQIIYTRENIVIQFTTSLLFGCLVFTIVERINQCFIHKNISSIESEYIAFNKLMLLIEYAKEFKTNSYKRNIFLGLLQKHRLKCFDELCQCHNYMKVLNELSIADKNLSNMNDNLMFRKVKIKKVVLDGAAGLGGQNNDQPNNGERITERTLPNNNKTFESNNIETEGDNNAIKSLQGKVLDLSMNDCIYGTIRIYLETLIKINSKSINLNIIYSYLMTYYLNNIYKALFELMKVAKRELSMWREYELFCLHNEIEKIMYRDYISHKEDDFHIEKVLKYNDLINKVLELMNKTAHETILFWTNVGVRARFSMYNKPAPENTKKNGLRVYEHAINISKNIVSMKELYSMLINNIKFRNKNILRLYSDFLEKIIFNEHDSEEIKEQINIFEREPNLNSEYHPVNENIDYMSSFVNMDEVGTIVISGNLIDIGKILIVNLQLCSIFQYDREELYKNSINKILPSYIANYHDQFIKRYLETAKTHILDKIRIVFGLSYTGLLIPVLLHVKIIPNLEQSIRFIGLLKKISKSHPFFQIPEQNLNDYIIDPISKDISFLMCNQQGYVFGITKPALINYGIPLNVLINANSTNNATGVMDVGANVTKVLNIRTLFQDSNFEEEEVAAKLRSEHGHLVKLDSRSLKNSFEDFKEALQEGNSYILKSLKKFNANQAFDEHEVLVFQYDISFNDGEVPAKIYKIVNVKKNKETNKNKGGNIFKFYSTKSTATVKSIYSKKSIKNIFDHNLFSNLHSKDIVEITQSNTNLNNAGEKTGLITQEENRPRLSSIDQINKKQIETNKGASIYNTTTSMLPKGNNFNHLNNAISAQELNKFKQNLMSTTVPKQVKLFIISFTIFLFILLVIGIVEFILTINGSNSLSKFIYMWDLNNKRNLFFTSIFLNTKQLILLDNNIYSDGDSFRERSIILEKLFLDLNTTIDFNNNLIYSIANIDDEINRIFNVDVLFAKKMEENFTITYDPENFSFVLNFILVKISALIELSNIQVGNAADLFYFNDNFKSLRSHTASELLREIFYIIENSTGIVRFCLERVLNRISIMVSTNSVLKTTARDVLCYFPFAVIIISCLIFLIVLIRINNYKIRILRVFFLVDKKYGDEIVRRCNNFLDNSHNFMKKSNKNIMQIVLDQNYSSKEIPKLFIINNKGINEFNPSSNYLKGSYKGIPITNYNRSNSSSGNLLNVNFVPKADKDFSNPDLHNFSDGSEGKKLPDSSPHSKNESSSSVRRKRKNKIKDRNQGETDSAGNQFWAKDSKEEDIDKKINPEDEEELIVNKELDASKAKFRRNLCLIYFKLIIVVFLVAIYYVITIILNMSFTSALRDNSEKLFIYTNRGWSFNNFLIYQKEMIMQNNIVGYVSDYSNTTYLWLFDNLHASDYYNLYYNQSYYIENHILLLTTLGGAGSQDFLQDTITLDNSLNTNNFCALLKGYDPVFYSNYLQNCDNFYANNNGIKDSISLISQYLKTNAPKFYNQSLDTTESILTKNWTFIDNTEVYINQAILFEMETLTTSVNKYITKNINTTVLRTVLYIILLIVELLVLLYVTRYLTHMLNKDKAILTIIPNEAISASEKVQNALRNLKNSK